MKPCSGKDPLIKNPLIKDPLIKDPLIKDPPRDNLSAKETELKKKKKKGMAIIEIHKFCPTCFYTGGLNQERPIKTELAILPGRSIM